MTVSRYYFSVSAYEPGPVSGARSAEISRYPNLAPSLNNPGSQSSTAGAPAALQLTGSDPEGVVLTYGASGLPPGLTMTPSNGSIAGVPTTTGSYTVTATATDGWLSDAKTFTWAVAQAASPNPPAPTNPPAPANPPAPTNPPAPANPPAPTNPPSPTPPTNLAPTLNNPGAHTTTAGTSVTLQLGASDPEGVVLRYGASGLPAGLQVSTTTGHISGAPTVPGTYVVTATATDGALSDAETFTWSVVQSTSDSVAPVLRITVPTTASTYTSDNPFVTLGGMAWDDRRVALVEWTSDRMGNGVASGKENWLAGVPLMAGSNTITIRAHDEAGNVSTKTIVVKANIPSSRPGTGRGRAKRPLTSLD